MPDIRHYSPRSGRTIKEDGSLINVGDLLEQLVTGGKGYDSVQDGFRLARGYRYEKIMSDAAVAPNAEYPMVADVAGFSQVFVMAIGSGTFDLDVQASPDGSYLMGKESLAAGVAANVGVSKQVNGLAPYLNVILKNTGASSANYTVWVYGV